MVSTGDVVCLECDGINEHKPGCSSQEDQEFTVLSVYSRKQAVDDGVLVDCAQPPFDELNRQAGIKVHLAMTAEAFHGCVYPLGVSEFPIRTEQMANRWQMKSSRPYSKLPSGQGLKGRYWDVVWTLRAALYASRDDIACVGFQLLVVPNEGGNAKLVELKCVAGPDDEGDLCLTIMLPEQD
jgi:hypothetical protein